jgi:hypothetical protein
MSKIEVDAIDKQSGSTLTLGGSGTAVTLACGATQTGFGREGSVDWQTGSIKTTTFTAANGEGYFVDTSSGGVTCNLPAGSAGAIVAFADYTRTFGTNALTVTPNGSEKIGGIAASMLLQVDGEAATLVYVDGTEGWINVQQTETSNTGNPFLVASGGTESISGNCKIHTFTGPGTFTVGVAAQCAANNIVSYLVVAGGGSAGTPTGSGGSGGGGAGGFREVKSPVTPYTASPLDGYPSAPNRITVTAQGYPIQVGGGGPVMQPGPVAGACGAGVSGTPSIFSTITSAGGGGGGGKDCAGSGETGLAGGSGGGARYGPNTGGAGNTPPVSPAQGQNGGNTPSTTRSASGGGGAGGTGGNGFPGSGYPTGSQPGGDGGAGVTTEITASPVAYAGGGGGGKYAGTNGAGGTGGGGAAGNPGVNGTANTGGGGGGGSFPATGTGGAGGSGIVVIRYKFQ